jgi:hypothetical protein
MSTARLPDERFRMIEAGEAGTGVVGADLTLVGAAEAGHRVQRSLLGSPPHKDVVEILDLPQHQAGCECAHPIQPRGG